MLTGVRRLNWLSACTEELFVHIYEQLMLFLQGTEEFPANTELPIFLYIMSPGGDISPVFAWYDLLNSILSPRPNIIAVGTGSVASAAVITLLSVPRNQRFVTPNTLIYLHQSNLPLPDGAYSASEIRGMKKCLDWGDKRYNEIIAFETGLSVRKIQNMRLHESVITPADAKRLGFVHDILHLEQL